MIATAYYNVGHIIALFVLLVGSAFFSGSETAFFNLTGRQTKQLGASKLKVQRLAARLLTKPGLLLTCLLLGNIIVNVLYYAISSTLVFHSKATWGLAPAAGVAVGTFLALILLGEILPKSLAYTNSRSFAVGAALPVFLCVQLSRPAAFIFRFFFLEPVLRLVLGHHRHVKAITLNEFRSLIDSSRRRGLITEDENKLLAEVVELGYLKVRHVMQPRVDMVAREVATPPAAAGAAMREHGLTKMPIYVKDIDKIIGVVYLRQLLLQPDASLDRLVQPVHFVPEQKTVESLLEFFRKSETDMAIVIDEYGGIAGSVRLEDIAEELFGDVETAPEEDAIEQLGPFRYRLPGDLAVHDWADVFGVDLDETRMSTLGGLVTALLGKIPRKGDIATLGSLKFTVDRMRGRRIDTIILSFERIGPDE